MTSTQASAPSTTTALIVLAVVAVAIGAAVWSEIQRPVGRSAAPATPRATVTDITPRLGTVFHPGAIQGFGANQSSIFLAGIGVWDRPADLTLPVIASLGPTGDAVNFTPTVNSYFAEGGVFGSVWNGSSWMLSGEASVGSVDEGVLIAGSGDRWTDLTPSVGPYFLDGGVWSVGWNGTGWLLAGNSSSGATLVSYDGGVFQDRTALLPHNHLGDWIQLLVWNGSAWMVGGKGTFGTYSGGVYHDLFPESPFTGGGAYAADWNGTAWLVGGGPTASIIVVRGDVWDAAPALPASFDLWPGSVIWTPSGWLIGGKGSGPTHSPSGSEPELAFWPSMSPGVPVQDWSSLLPAPFAGGQVQFGWWAPLLGDGVILLVGQGALNAVTGYSDGAMAILQLH